MKALHMQPENTSCCVNDKMKYGTSHLPTLYGQPLLDFSLIIVVSKTDKKKRLFELKWSFTNYVYKKRWVGSPKMSTFSK